MEQELQCLYLLSVYGGPFDYNAISFIDIHISHLEIIVK